MTSQLKVVEYKGFQGGFFDSVAHADIFRDQGPYEFGVMSSKLFSSATMLGMTNKKWTYMTIAQGNVFQLPAGTNELTWSVAGDADIDCTIMEDVLAGNTTPGKNNQIFEVVTDKPHLKKPMVLKTDSDNAPLLEVVSEDAEPYGTQYWKIRIAIQDGNPNSYIEPTWLAPGRRLIRVGTWVSNEENPDYGVDEYNSMMKLRSVVAQYANHVVFTDRFIRQEMQYAKSGVSHSGTYTDSFGQSTRGAFSKGIIYQASLTGNGNNKIKAGFVIPEAEKRLLERTEADREHMCEWGRVQYKLDENNRVKKMANGWRTLVRDGQYLPHGGNFTLNQLYEFLHAIFLRRRRFMNREPYLCSGSGGCAYISTLIAAQAADFQTINPGWLGRDVASGDKTGVHKHEKEWGYQFTRILLPMGVTVSVMYDPSKDDDKKFRELAPGSTLPLESFQIDILDFGKTEDADELSNKKNITMIQEQGADYYFSIGNQVDWKTGHVRDGSNTYNFNKTFSIYREMSGSLNIWDVSAVGRIEWIPGYVG